MRRMSSLLDLASIYCENDTVLRSSYVLDREVGRIRIARSIRAKVLDDRTWLMRTGETR
jgi:hypothetical protein